MTSIIIPSRKTENLRACIAAIDEHNRLESIRLIVVDDGLAERPQNQGRLSVILGVKPFIFARNCNLGIRAAGDDDVILLNDDALLTTPDGFSRLIKASQAHPEYGVIAAASNMVGNVNQRPRGAGLREEPRMVNFVCVWIPRRTLKAVGLLDEIFTSYGFEDDDYCLRVRKAGMKLGIYDGCVMDHKTLKSTFRGAGHPGLVAGCKIFMQKWGHDTLGRPPIGAMR